MIDTQELNNEIIDLSRETNEIINDIQLSITALKFAEIDINVKGSNEMLTKQRHRNRKTNNSRYQH